MKLKKRQRVDGVRNEVRAPGKPWGKYFYLCLVAGFLFWLFDLFLGDLFYFRANGLVVQDRVVLATQFDASVQTLGVEEGASVSAGQTVAVLRSQSVEENIAELSADVARMIEQASRLQVRKQVIEATRPLAEQRVNAARAARQESLKWAEHFTSRDRLARLQDELASLEASSTDVAEYEVITADLPKLEAAIAAAQKALDRLSESYAQGVLQAPVDGVVGYLHVARGSVVNKATPMMEIYTGSPYVLAYVPEGAVYELAPGDQVEVEIGFRSYAGIVRQIYPISAALPDEYVDALRVPQRAPLAKIDFLDVERYPTLFAQTEVSASGWPPRWVHRLLGVAEAAPLRERFDSRSIPAIEPKVDIAEAQEPLPASGFTLQLLALPNRDAVVRYARALGLGRTQVVAVQAHGQVMHALIHGYFADRQSALAAAARIDGKPWVRPLSSLSQVLTDSAAISLSTLSAPADSS